MTPPDSDVVVIGAGAGGGIAAALLAEAGLRVLLVERGAWRDHPRAGQRDHLRNHRMPIHGHNTGPPLALHPRVLADGAEQAVLSPIARGHHNNAVCVGGGTAVYGGLAWRFAADDFRMAARYGVPTGSSLVDWPLSAAEMAPFYARAEDEIGVAGEPGPHGAPVYPMPPVPPQPATGRLRAGAARLGLPIFAPPLLVNTIPRAGRAACIGCGSCVGFPCPSDGKNGTQNTMVPRALRTGRCTLLTETTASRIAPDARGVALVDNLTGARRVATARAVVLAAGAIESARLLLISGLGNGHDQVGRHLQGHAYPTAFGLFDDPVAPIRGPGVSIATRAFSHGNPGIIGGGVLADDFVMLPIAFWRTARPPEVPGWGQPAKDFMRQAYCRTIMVRGPVHEIPSPECRVTLDPAVTDRWGLPVARLSGTMHAETLRSGAFLFGRAAEWLGAAGARRVWGAPPGPRLSAGQHQAGTCRMSDDPALGVTDRWGRVWGHDNLFVSDASLHPTNGGANPVLTVMALAFRNAAEMARRLG